MNKLFLIINFVFFCVAVHGQNQSPAIEKFTYSENFEDRELGAWASYPHWQDLAYDQNFRVNEIVPGDRNISLEQKVTPYTNVDNYAGTQKLLNMFLVPGSKVTLRYYLKTHLAPESFKVRFAGGSLGKLDVTVLKPETNKWVSINLRFEDFVRENPLLAGKNMVEVFALAVLAKFPAADPAMPIYLGLDDIIIEGAQTTHFRFAEPVMHKLPEFPQYIPNQHYNYGDNLKLRGQWTIDPQKVFLEIFLFTDHTKSLYKGELLKQKNIWFLKPLPLLFADGLYIARLSAFEGQNKLAVTEFTIHIAPENIAGKHPRLLFDSGTKSTIEKRLKEDSFKNLYGDIVKNAKTQRTRIPVASLVYDLDQFPDEDWLPSWSAMGSHIFHTGGALQLNALAYAFHGDAEAGKYVKDVFLKLSDWPDWTHPWLTKRGRYSEHRSGSWSHRLAEAYDLTYGLMTEEERIRIRNALMKNIVQGVHRTYVYNNDITANTSNWIAMTVGGSLMNIAAMFGDGPDTEKMEPYFTGAMIKYYSFINSVADSADGSWGEGLGYNNYSFLNMSYSVPSLLNVFNIDVTAPLKNTYNEFIWGGIVKEKKWFEFGDSGGDLGPATNWAFLLNRQKNPRLSWYYNYLKKENTFEDILYNNKVPVDSPFDENPVKVFRKIGTTVFKSGWEKNDMVFTMRTGPFYNHQHLDQGSFWFADRGVTFIEERHLHNSNYYDDPLYQSHLIQPVGHSTILIDNNHQSQRAGDHLHFAPGFNDHASITQFLDGKYASFSRGDIGKLYWDKITSLSRNVLFLKPRTLLMLDEAVPGKTDVDVTLLYHTEHLEDINPGRNRSAITKEGATLHIVHLSPGGMESKAVETSHYLKTLQTVKPLKKEGMLTLTARTKGAALVMANLLTSTAEEDSADVTRSMGKGFVEGTASGKKFAFNTNPGNIYKVGDLETDALAMTWGDNNYFVTMSTIFHRNGNVIVEADAPVTFEYSGDTIKYYHEEGGKLIIGRHIRPSSLLVNGKIIKTFIYDNISKTIRLTVPKGEGSIIIKSRS